jgi:acetyltransferase EpsM
VSRRPKLVIWGASGHARVVADIVRLRAEFEIAGFIDDVDPQAAGREFFGCRVLGGREQLSALREAGVSHLVFGFGDGAARLRLAPVVRELGFTLATAVHPSAVVATDVVVGPGTVIVAGAVVGPGSMLGENVIVNTLAGLSHDGLVGNGVHICPGACLGGWAEVGEGSWIGIGATLRDRVKVGRNTVIGAGAVVLRDIPDEVVAYGVPARVVRGN